MSLMQNSEADFERRCLSINAMIRRILHMEDVSPPEWHTLFADVFNVVMWYVPQGANRIRESLTDSIGDYLTNVRKLVLESHDDSSLLKTYSVQWTKFSDRAEYLPLAFGHLDTHLNGKHQTNQSQRQLHESSVRKLMMETWKSKIYEEIRFRLINSAVHLIGCERRGQVIDSDRVGGFRNSCADLSNITGMEKLDYLSELVKAYIEDMENYFRPLIAAYIQEHGIRDQLLAEVPKLLRENNMDMLKQFYDLVHRIPNGSEHICHHFEPFVNQTGLESIKANAESKVKDASKYVNLLLELYNRYTTIVDTAFYNDPLLLASRDRAYQEIVNSTIYATDIPSSLRSGVRRPESQCPELLASYCDLMLRKSTANRRLSSEEVEKMLDNVLLVLKYVNSKDIFMRFYKTHLMRRLLLGVSTDNELEKVMVDRLRNVGMPAEQLNKLSRMFQDMQLSHDLTISFKNTYRSTSGSSPISPTGSLSLMSTTSANVDMINILILTSGSWVLQSERKASICLPSELEDFLPQIEDFYHKKHQGRNLIWQHHLSHGVVLFTSDRGRFELELTAHQLVILYAWNQRFDQRLNLDSLITATSMQDSELRRTVWVIYLVPVGLPRFFVSKSGKSQARRRLNLIGRLQLTQEATNEDETMAIVKLRHLRAEEGIVKILKARKRLSFNELYNELVELLRFQFVPSKRLIKEVLEGLIDGQYVQRDDVDKNMFVYMT
ncbi:cullin 5 [Paragonimus westermani]|uniref:Cullin-5 n=1 Tax=Paragonimus westermani TaxID=34504 RepID=A0A5J4P021_9TREM|nr:cullin 5 [Paragonimus westermani]